MPTVGKLNVTIGADTTSLTKGLDKALGDLKRFITIGALAALARQAIDYGSAINDAATKSGVAAKWLQETAYAAKLAGGSLDEVTNALVELRRAQSQALSGSAADVANFRALGISVQDLRVGRTEDLFDKVASAIEKTSGGMKEVNAALGVLGRGGRGILAAMVGGLSEARMEAQRLGLVLSDSTISKMDKLGDHIDQVKLAITASVAETLAWAASFKSVKEALQTVWSLSVYLTPEKMIRSLIYQGPSGLAEYVKQSFLEARKIATGGEDVTNPKTPTIGGGIQIKGSPPKATDDLARIGGYMGDVGPLGGSASLLRTQNAALVELRRMREFLGKLADRKPGQVITW